MSILDNNILEETELFSGFPNKEDYIHKYITENKKRTDGNNAKMIAEICYYNCICPYFKKKYYMPYGFRIMAVKYPMIAGKESPRFILKITAIDEMDISGPYMDDIIGCISYEYKDEIPNILYDFIERIKDHPVRFLEMYEAKANWMGEHLYLRDFFEIDEKYKFIK